MSIYLPRNRHVQRLIYLFLLSLLGSITQTTHAAAQQTATTNPMPAEILLWPDQHPEPRVSSSPAESQVKGDDGLTRRFNVSVPRLFVYLPDKQRATGAAVIVAPGGGFARLADEHESSDVCRWLNSLGIVGLQLAYRTPTNKHSNPVEGPAQDLQQAIVTVRSQAAELNIDPQRIGVIGFSAGGQTALVATAGKPLIPVHGNDSQCRPNLMLLIYPYQVLNADSSALRSDITLAASIPPTFIAQSVDDKSSPPEGSARLMIELTKMKVPVELHIYETGGHGFGMRHRTPPPGARDWSNRAADWLQLHKFAAAR